MRREEILQLADRVVRPAFRERDIEEIDVREEEDWSGTPSIVVEVFMAPAAQPPDVDSWFRMKRMFSRELLAAGDMRFPFVRLRNRAEEEDEEEPEEAAW